MTNFAYAFYGVKLAVLCVELIEVLEVVVQDWAQRLPELCKDYAPKDIFNADETGLYFRALPTRSMVVKGNPCKGVKVYWEGQFMKQGKVQ